MQRAFTIIEILVALTLGVVVLGTTTSLAVLAGQDHDAGRRRAHLARTASFLDRNLARDLRHAGLGMPTGPFHTGVGTYNVGEGRFNAPVLIGTTDSIGIVGDLPRPDADGAPFGSLASLPGSNGVTSSARFWWFNDNTGTCIPSLSPTATSCRLSRTSRLMPGGAECNTIAGGDDATCPWGLRRLVADEYFVVTAGDGSWGLAKMPKQAEIGSTTLVTAPDGRHLLFQSASGVGGDWDPIRWRNVDPQVDAPVALRGQGYVSSPDRVFYFKRGGTLQRVQCYGAPDPDNAAFPSANVLTMPDVSALAYTLPGGRSPGPTCIGPELIADHVESVAFTFTDKNGATLALPLDGERKKAVRGIRWRVVFKDSRAGRQTVNETLEGAIALRNIP